MNLSKKKVFYIRMVRDNNMLSNMSRTRMVKDLEEYGIKIDDNSDIGVEAIKGIYKCLINHVSKKYQDKIF